MTKVVSLRDVRPVGQGAFIRGQAEIHDISPITPRRVIRWIYDCGTDHKREIIDASVHDLGASWPTKKKLDVLIISHFDKDHISGLPTLLSRYAFDRILMPHLPRLVRLLAVVERIEDEAPMRLAHLLAFADDPVEYIRSNGGGDTEIVLVNAVEEDEPPVFSDPNPSDAPLDSKTVLNKDLLGEQTYRDVGSEGSVSVVDSGRAIVFDPSWELIPYVDLEVRKKLLNFDLKFKSRLRYKLRQVLILARKLTGTNIRISKADSGASIGKVDVKAKKEMKKALKQAIYCLKQAVYEAIEAGIGTKPTSKHKNAISLMAYMGATTTNQVACACTQVEVGVGPEDGDLIDEYAGDLEKGTGLLLTGDADVTYGGVIDRLVAYMTPRRIQMLGVFQVPHHGSKHNSSQETADQLSAPFNVFNANPQGRHGHPDTEVVDRFSSAVLVNARGFEVVSVASDDVRCIDLHPWCCLRVANSKFHW